MIDRVGAAGGAEGAVLCTVHSEHHNPFVPETIWQPQFPLIFSGEERETSPGEKFSEHCLEMATASPPASLLPPLTTIIFNK